MHMQEKLSTIWLYSPCATQFFLIVANKLKTQGEQSMKPQWISLCTVVLALTLASTDGLAQNNKNQRSSVTESSAATAKKFSLKPTLGYAFLNPTAVNGFLGDTADKFNVDSTYKISGTSNFSLIADYEIIKNFAAGIRLDYFKASSDSVTFKAGNTKATAQSYISAVPVYANATYTQPLNSQWKIGGSFGFGMPLSFQAGTKYSGSDINNLKNGEEVYTSRPSSWVAGAFGQYQISESVGIRAGIDYRRLVSTQFKLREKYGNRKAGSLLEDNDNANLKVDASSFISVVGVTVGL